MSLLNSFLTTDHTVDNTYTFVDRITSLPKAQNYVMAYFAVENLFSNIPLRETVVIGRLFERDGDLVDNWFEPHAIIVYLRTFNQDFPL